MLPRTLWLAGIPMALLGLVDQATAQAQLLLSGPVEIASVQSNDNLKQVTYPVADLVVPPDLDVDPLPSRLQGKGKEPSDAKAKRDLAELVKSQTIKDALVSGLISKIAPTSWQGRGGQGTIQFFPESQAMLISQTRTVHEEIAAKLAAMRKLNEQEVVLECRIVQVSPKGLERARQAMNIDFREPLNDIQAFTFMEAAQDEQRPKIMQAHKITVFNGQTAKVEVIDHQFFLTGVETNSDKSSQTYFTPNNQPIGLGLRLALRPDVSADQRFVRLKLNGYWAQLAGPVPLIPVQIPLPQILEGPGSGTTVLGQPIVFQMFLQQPNFGQIRFNQEVSIPDGGTLLLHGGTVPCEVKRTDFGARLSSLFGGNETTWKDHHIMMMITARIIDHSDAERSVRLAPIPKSD